MVEYVEIWKETDFCIFDFDTCNNIFLLLLLLLFAYN